MSSDVSAGTIKNELLIHTSRCGAEFPTSPGAYAGYCLTASVKSIRPLKRAEARRRMADLRRALGLVGRSQAPISQE